jgi:hypothetical protein
MYKKFAIFGLVDYFLCILQDLDINMNLNFKFKTGFDRGFDWPIWTLTGLRRGAWPVADTVSIK